jgi:hypothetical protein
MNRLIPRSWITAGVLLLVFVPPFIPAAWADSFICSNLIGTGSYEPSPGSPLVDFYTTHAVMTIDYTLFPGGLRRGSLSLSLPDQGVGVLFPDDPQFFHLTGGIAFVAFAFDGGEADAFLAGDPGPLDQFGNPLSLEGLLGRRVSVRAFPPNPVGLTFTGGTVPEPSSLPTLATGIGGVALACVVRRTRERTAPPGAGH